MLFESSTYLLPHPGEITTFGSVSCKQAPLGSWPPELNHLDRLHWDKHGTIVDSMKLALICSYNSISVILSSRWSLPLFCSSETLMV
jgi:hypothetical protein